MEYPDAVQVIARADEAWAFIDIERSVREPGAIAGAPRSRVIQQVAVVFNEGGVKQVLPVSSSPRFYTFNRNLSTVFALDDGLYILSPPDTLGRWDGSGFAQFPFSRTDFPRLHALAATPPYQEDPVLEEVSRRHGWTPVMQGGSSFDSAEFTWNNGRFVLDCDKSTSPAAVRLRGADMGKEWSTVVAQYNATPRRANPGE